MSGLKLVLVFLVCAAVVAPLAVESITCGQVVGSVSKCLPFLRNTGPLQPECCTGVKGLVASGKTTADRQAICNCLKSASNGINLANAKALPGRCGVSIPYAISPSTNCATIT